MNLCHGPDCTKEADGDFCSEQCSTVWQRQFGDADFAATVLLEWVHPVRGRIAENVCDKHHLLVRQALGTLGIGCIGQSFDAQVCVRCAHDGQDVRGWLRECVETPERRSA